MLRRWGCLLLWLPVAWVQAAEPGFDLPGFDVTADVDSTATERKGWKQTLSYDVAQDRDGGTISNRLGWRLQWDGLVSETNYVVVDAKLRLFDEQDLQYEGNAALDYDSRINALYLQRSFQSHSVSLGYQTINLGVMDMLSINDVLTPWDYSEPSFTAPEDARIGQALLNWSWFGGQRWDVLLNLHPTGNRYAGANLNGLLAQRLGSDNFILRDAEPDPLAEPELILRTRIIRGPHEQQWLAGSLLQNEPTISLVSAASPTQVFELRYPRYSLFGGGYSYTTGNHQWRLEAAYKKDLQPLALAGVTLDESTAGLGWEYNANGAYTLTVEAGRRWWHLPAEAPAGIETAQDQVYARWSKTFWHETVTLTLFAGRLTPGATEIYSASVRYTPWDDWVVECLGTRIDAPADQSGLLTSSMGLRVAYYW